MSNGKSELFVFLGASFATLFGLVALQQWYGSYIDIRHHQRLQEGGPSEALLTSRRDDELQAQKRKLPLDQAISRLAQRGRGSFSSIAPAPSQDLSAIAGWIHHPGFKPVTAHPIRTPRATAVVAAPVTEASAAPVEQAAPAAPVVPAAPRKTK
ncbi:MAG: hypothetical protein RL701_2855 [Pseudomonadota bacterium]